MRLNASPGLASLGVGFAWGWSRAGILCSFGPYLIFSFISGLAYKFPPCNSRCLKIINGNPDWFRRLFFIIFLDFNLISKQAKAISISAAFP